MIIWQRLHDGCRKGKEVSLRAGVECGEEGKTSSTTNSSLVFDQHNSDFGLHWKIAKGSWKNASWKKKKRKMHEISNQHNFSKFISFKSTVIRDRCNNNRLMSPCRTLFLILCIWENPWKLTLEKAPLDFGPYISTFNVLAKTYIINVKSNVNWDITVWIKVMRIARFLILLIFFFFEDNFRDDY